MERRSTTSTPRCTPWARSPTCSVCSRRSCAGSTSSTSCDPPARGGQRHYTRSEIGRIQQVTLLAGDGMTLNSIRRILQLEAEVADLRRQLGVEHQRKAARARTTPAGAATVPE